MVFFGFACVKMRAGRVGGVPGVHEELRGEEVPVVQYPPPTWRRGPPLRPGPPGPAPPPLPRPGRPLLPQRLPGGGDRWARRALPLHPRRRRPPPGLRHPHPAPPRRVCGGPCSAVGGAVRPLRPQLKPRGPAAPRPDPTRNVDAAQSAHASSGWSATTTAAAAARVSADQLCWHGGRRRVRYCRHERCRDRNQIPPESGLLCGARGILALLLTQ